MIKIFKSAFLIFGLGFFTKCQASSYGFTNPIGHNSITSFVEGILTSVQGIAGWLTVIFIVIGGVLYLTAGGKDSQLTWAKNTIIYALIGFALAVGGPSLLKEIKDIVTTPGAFDIDNANSLGQILTNLLQFLLSLIALLALIVFIYSGFNYLGASGDRTKAENAKKIATYAIIALAVSGGSLLIINTILGFLNI